MSHHKLGWRVGQPLRKRQVLVEAALEHLEKDQVCVPSIFDVMQKRLFNVPDVSLLKIHRASAVACGHHRHSPLTRDVILPLVGVGVPVQLPQTSRVYRDHCHRDVSCGLECTRVNDTYLSTFGALCWWPV